MFRKLILSTFLLTFAAALAGCGDTWRGFREDTGENLGKVGSGLENTGDKVDPTR